MLVKFRVNLGSNDAKALGLDWTKCKEGMECEVSEKIAEALGGAIEPVEIKAVPKAAKIKGE